MTTINQIKNYLDSSPADLSLLGLPLPRCTEVYPGDNWGLVGEFSLFELASMQGRVEHLKALPWSKEAKRRTVQRADFSAIRAAAYNGHLPTLHYLLEEVGLSTEDKLEAIKWENYFAIRDAAGKGHLPTLNYLLEEVGLSTEDKLKAIKASGYAAIRWAASNGQLATLQYLLEEVGLSTEDKLQAIKVDRYLTIRLAAQNGHLPILHYLLEEVGLSTEEKLKAIKADDYYAIREASRCKRHPIINYFLTFDAGLAYLESHDQENGQTYVYAFVAAQLEGLKGRKEAYEQTHPAGVFDVEAEEARRCFYLLRNLIRRGVRRDYADAEPNVDELGFLLTIPAVKNLAHQELNEGGSNELLRLACHLGNSDATVLL
ncbi:ankyrin repeat domain-containing protein, partial [Legionella sp. km772]|uniref:ankyrin repeat domain-containing protein n=1 Tax=Legionella sp. km772 TaxID=2498111 RepID=UPI000FB66296